MTMELRNVPGHKGHTWSPEPYPYRGVEDLAEQYWLCDQCGTGITVDAPAVVDGQHERLPPGAGTATENMPRGWGRTP